MSAWAGFFLGLGAFPAVRRLIDHKLLRLHQVFYGGTTSSSYELA
jgi:uncharacterized membrane protein